jgi:hypothetical protein
MPSSDRASALLALQQTHGNHYVQRVVTGIQAKLKVGPLGDKYEQEADRVAEQVMQMPEPQMQRQQEEEKEEEKKKKEKILLQAKPLTEQITPLVQRQPIEEEEEAEELPSMPEFRLTPPSLSLPGLSSPHFPHLELEMPMRNTLRFVERRLDPALIWPALLQIDPRSLTLPSPTETGTVPETVVTPPSESTPLVPAGPGPETPREATGGDVIRALMAVPTVDTALTNLQTWASERVERDWERLSIGEQIATITATAVFGGGALAGVLSHPETRQAAINLLTGRTFPVPGVEGLQFEVGIRGNDWTVGFHLDVGALLPASLGFGPSSPSAFGPPPIPEGGSESESGATVQRQLEEPQLQRQREDEEEEEEEIQAKEKPSETPEVTPDLEARIEGLRGGGRPLPESTRAFFESRFDQDFRQVRIHTDNEAAETAQALKARAFTVERDIVFASGQYVPEATAGKTLLAHELTHVLQQESAALVQQEVEQTSAPSDGTVTISEPVYTSYEVTGSSLAEVAEQLDPVEYGRCSWNYNYSQESTNGVATRVNVTLTLTIRLPQWTGQGWENASAAAKGEWQRMLARLRTHESGHADIARCWADTLQQQLLNQPEADLSTIWGQGLADHGDEQEAYDTMTQHGQTQGVTLDISKE